MLIDFHTHIFPDKIAQKTIEYLKSKANIPAYTNGTLDGLKSSMVQNNVDYSVVLPVATKQSQVESINNFSSEINNMENIFSFGGMHPLYENYKVELKRIKDMRLKGIKLHCDYQEFFVDDKAIFPMISYAKELGLAIIFHGGVDIGIPGDVHCTPKRARNLINAVGGGKLIFAHFGGYDCWDDVEKYLVGEDIYLDTSYTLNAINHEQFKRIVNNHGSDKILFASDSPWGDAKSDYNILCNMGFSKQQLDNITYKNAINLLGI